MIPLTDQSMQDSAVAARAEIREFLREQHNLRQPTLLKKFDRLPFYVRWILFYWTPDIHNWTSDVVPDPVIPAAEITPVTCFKFLETAVQLRNRLDEAIKILSELIDPHD